MPVIASKGSDVSVADKSPKCPRGGPGVTVVKPVVKFVQMNVQMNSRVIRAGQTCERLYVQCRITGAFAAAAVADGSPRWRAAGVLGDS